MLTGGSAAAVLPQAEQNRQVALERDQVMQSFVPDVLHSQMRLLLLRSRRGWRLPLPSPMAGTAQTLKSMVNRTAGLYCMIRIVGVEGRAGLQHAPNPA